MGLKAGIVGLPNVGKSTLFNAITNSSVEAANYPFATIEPNIGIVNLLDERVDKLEKLYQSNKKIYANFTFIDIAGLVKGASKGEGLGNKFLSNIREVDAICHVVRCFDSKEITHVVGGVNPTRDVEIIDTELMISDLESVDNRIYKIKKKAGSGDAEAQKELDLLNKFKENLNNLVPLRRLKLYKEELAFVKSFEFLTLKPVIYVANMDESEISSYEDNKYFQELKKLADAEGAQIIPISAKIESEISKLDEEDKKDFLEDIGIQQSGLALLTEKAYKLLNLSTFFTCGKQEIHAWTFKNGMIAPEVAGIIHTDFEKGFIKAEVFSYDDLIELGSEKNLKEKGKMRLEGKNYIVKDGDICHFRFNV